MNDRWEHVSAILLGLAAVITAAVKGLPPLLRYLGARGREASEHQRLTAQAEVDRLARATAREDRVLAALEAAAVTMARSTEVSERVLRAIVEQGDALQRMAESVVSTGDAVRVLLEDRRRRRRTGAGPLDSEESVPAASDGEDSSLRLGEG